MRSREARNVFTRLAELSVHGANVQEGQIVLVAAEVGLEEQADARDAHALQVRIEVRNVDELGAALVGRLGGRTRLPDTLDFVPQWYGGSVLEHAEQNGARISLRSVTAPNVMDGLDKSLLGKDTVSGSGRRGRGPSTRVRRRSRWCSKR